MLDSALLITLFIIIGAAVLGAIVAARVRDPCIKQWHGYPVDLLLVGGARFEGRIHSESSGIEIGFASAQRGAGGAERYSFVLYRDEYASIDKVVRYLDALTPAELNKREGALRHAYRPGLHRRMARRARNWLNTLKDAFADAAGAVAGHAGMKAQAGRASSTSAVMVGSLGRAHDPLLERHIGQRVVVIVDEHSEDEIEFEGIFREYSSAFLSIVDVAYALDGADPRTADLLLSRPRAAVRAAGEAIQV